MTTADSSMPGLVVDPVLATAWRSCGAPEPRGLAGAVIRDHAAVVAVVESVASETDWTQVCAPALGRALGVRTAEIVLVPDVGLTGMVRDWAYQAAQGSGRGVHIKVETQDDGGNGVVVRLLVRALDSSARELAARLASPTEPAVEALRALLSGTQVEVIDVEGDTAGTPT